jgi:outer membrane protein OmpA-like peptidoglycan-associated protein
MEPTQSRLLANLPDPGPDQEYQVIFPEESPGATRYIHLTLGEDIAAQCGLVRTHFEFDSADPLPQDQMVLKSLAECLDRPRYAGVQLALVGRADRRGRADYNAGLALRRAVRVKGLLVAAGMASARISTASRGDQGAVGDDVQYSFGYDRRVDAVVGAVHAPR